MPVPTTAGQRQEPVIERSRFIAAGLSYAAQAFSPADSVFDLDPATGVGRILGSLGVGRGDVGVFCAAAGLAVGQALSRQVVVGDQA